MTRRRHVRLIGTAGKTQNFVRIHRIGSTPIGVKAGGVKLAKTGVVASNPLPSGLRRDQTGSPSVVVGIVGTTPIGRKPIGSKLRETHGVRRIIRDLFRSPSQGFGVGTGGEPEGVTMIGATPIGRKRKLKLGCDESHRSLLRSPNQDFERQRGRRIHLLRRKGHDTYRRDA